jgi:hypothetical protein
MIKRLAVLRKLVAKPAGLSFIDLLLQTLDGRDVPHEPLLKICAKDPEIRDLGAEYIEALRALRAAVRRSRA